MAERLIRRLPAAAVLLFYAPLCGFAQTGPPLGSVPKPSAANSAPEAVTPGAAAPSAGRLLDEARGRLAAYRTVSATLKQTAGVDGRRFLSAGRLRLAAGGRVWFELNPVPAGSGSKEEVVGPALLQVCDGTVMHTQYAIGDRLAVTRRNVRTVREAAAQHPAGATLAADLSSGGLAGVLASLRTSLIWEQPRTETVADRPFRVLTGRWTASSRAAVDEQPSKLKPDGVTVYLDADRLFPHRIRYWTQEEGGPRVPALTLDLSEIRVNGPLPADAFVFVLPDGVEVDDLTDRAVQRARTAGLPAAQAPATDAPAGKKDES